MNETLLPAEWAPQSAVMLTWPHAETDWAPILPAVEQVYRDLAREIGLRQKVLISCQDASRLPAVREYLLGCGVAQENFLLFQVPADDTWARDHGPITVHKNNRPVLLNFRFNAWGGKYGSSKDDRINRELYNQGAFGSTPMEDIPFILEGGSIESDGQGTLLTTSACLLTDTRNAELDQAQIEEQLKQYLGVTRVLWLHHGHLAGDDTDSHIDTLARFCDPETICYVQCQDPADPHYGALQAMEKELQAFRTAEGKPYRLVPLPMPQAQYSPEGERLPATYANFLIMNQAVLVPVYGVPEDKPALDALATCFPTREIVAIDCRALIEQHGSLHCVTMQIPEGVL